MSERLYIFDTTLRDGAQTQGVDFDVEEKRLIAEMLDQLGVDYIEGGWPGANKTDTAFFDNPPSLSRAKLVAFGMTRRPGRSADNDPGLQTVLNAPVDAVCLVGKTWDFHVGTALNTTLDDNLTLIADSIQLAAQRKSEAMFDCEHFFDGFKANKDYALACAKQAYDAGARWVVLCDTNGGTLPEEIAAITAEVVKIIPNVQVGIHTHNDTEQAVANSFAAVTAGARQIQGTLNGLGERCGNANLVSILPTLLLKPAYNKKFDIGVERKNLKKISKIAHRLDDILNREPNRHQPYVGASAFVHKGGLHVAAVLKDPRTYEHVEPDAVGNQRKLPVSDQSGRSGLISFMNQAHIPMPSESHKIDRLLEEIKERESQGWAFEGAEASLEVLTLKHLGLMPEYFAVSSFKVEVERRYDAMGRLVTMSQAVVKVLIDGENSLAVAEGNGPVNALDNALRDVLRKHSQYRKSIEDLELVDFKVRIVSSGSTQAVTRVLIESSDRAGFKWFTVGVSPNIVDASFQAMWDSLLFKLYRDGRKNRRTA